MTTPPAGQSCSTCNFFVANTCRAMFPSAVLGPASQQQQWPPVDDNDWCGFWNCWPGQQQHTASGSFTYGHGVPSGGAAGDLYLQYTNIVNVNGGFSDLHIYQNQAGTWVVIATPT